MNQVDHSKYDITLAKQSLDGIFSLISYKMGDLLNSMNYTIHRL